MKIVISGGGTGGHIYPAITIANQIKSMEPTAEITFVGTEHGLEKNIVPRCGYPLKFITVAGFERHLSVGTMISGMKLLVGLKDARSLLKEIKPDLVIGTGGYVCGPVLFWAAQMGIPTCIQEQNAMPGVTNKILSHFVDIICLGYNEGAQYFSGRARKIFTGNPVRQEILKDEREDGFAKFSLDKAKKTILVFGGSRGARSINNAMLELEKAMAGRTDVQILHATGELDYEKYKAQLAPEAQAAENIKVVPYLHEMPLALSVADLAIARSGAIGLAELLVKGIPAILIPYPYATANHQEFNARAIAKAGAAEVILDKELTGMLLREKVEQLLTKPDTLAAMHTAAQKLSRPEAAKEIAQSALSLVKTK